MPSVKKSQKKNDTANQTPHQVEEVTTQETTPVSTNVTATSTTTPAKTSSKPKQVKSTTKSSAKTTKHSTQTDKETPTPTTTTATTHHASTADIVETNEVVVASVPTSVSDHFTEFLTKFQQIVSEFSTLKSQLKLLEKKTMKELKIVTKLQNKRKKKQGTRAPSGFVKPTKISDELAVFLQKPSGTEMARTDVTREINQYIRQHSLQDPSNGRKINPDDKLAKLLKVTETDELTYFNLQRYMSPHFTKSIPNVATSSTA